jgi:hypothetical protein
LSILVKVHALAIADEVAKGLLHPLRQVLLAREMVSNRPAGMTQSPDPKQAFWGSHLSSASITIVKELAGDLPAILDGVPIQDLDVTGKADEHHQPDPNGNSDT